MATSGAPQAAFQQLRPPCVHLLHVSKNLQNGHAVLEALKQVLVALNMCGPLTPALIHYVFFPVSQLLRAHDAGIFALQNSVRVLVFRILSRLACEWWQTWTWAHVQTHSGSSVPTSVASSPDWKVWEQLLFLGVMTLSGGPPMTRVSNDNETREAVTHFLCELMRPRINTPRETDEEWEWDGTSDLPSLDTMDGPQQVYPSQQHVAAARNSRACSGALAHVLKLALDMCRETSTPPSLCRAALDLACVMAFTWIGGYTLVLGDDMRVNPSMLRTRSVDADSTTGSEQLRPILPGVASSLVKISTKATHAQVVARAVDMLTAMLVFCLHDALTAPYRPAPPLADASLPTSLEDFGKLTVNALMQADSDRDTDSMSDVSEQAEMSTPATSVNEEAEVPWLERTMQPVLIALMAIGPLREREDASIHFALAQSAYTLLICMPETLKWACRGSETDACRDLICTLLDMACDVHTERVVECARQAMRSIATPGSLRTLDSILDKTLSSLPADVGRVHDADLQRNARRIGVCASLLSNELRDVQMTAPDMAFLRFASPDGGAERWTDLLTSALCAAPEASGIMAADAVPHIRPALAQLEPGSIDALASMWYAWGSATAALLRDAAKAQQAIPRYQTAFFVPLYMMHAARVSRVSDIFRTRVYLVAMNEMMLGASSVLALRDMDVWLVKSEGRALRKSVHAFARNVVQEIQCAWDADIEEENAVVEKERGCMVAAEPTHDAAVVRGFSGMDDASNVQLTVGPALDVSFVDSARLSGQHSVPERVKQERALERRNSVRDQCDALLLCILAEAVSLLGVAARPLLLHTLYPVLGAFGRHDDLVRCAARYALERMSDACAYPSVQNCVLHHTDYVLGAASHRLVSGLRAELHAGMRVASIQPTQQTALMSARAAPWVLVQVIQMLGAEAVPWVEDAVDEVLVALDQFHAHEDVCDGLLAVLARLVAVLAPTQPPTVCAAPNERRPLDEFQQWLEQRETGEDVVDPPGPNQEAINEDPNPAPNRLQFVVHEILLRCVPFLSHASALLRIRALDMLSDGVAILAPQGRTAEVYPVLDRAWPLLLARLGTSATSSGTLAESDPNVWIHATRLISAIAHYVPEGFGRRIVKDVWPRWCRVLHEQRMDQPQPRAFISARHEQMHALQPQNKIHVFHEHATTSRVVHAIVEALTSLASSLSERLESAALWAMATHPALLDTLDARQARMLRIAGARMYRAFICADGMTLWIILRAVAGQGAPWYLSRSIQWAPEFTW